MAPSSDTGGVKAFPIEGPFKDERTRLAGMTDADRAFRRQWLKDQILAESEPAKVPGWYEARYNPIRRFYRWPLDTLFKPLVPLLGYESAAKYRWFTGKFLMLGAATYAIYYYFKYNRNTFQWEESGMSFSATSRCRDYSLKCSALDLNDWKRKGGWRVIHSKPMVTPLDPEFPKVSERKVGADYASRGFKDSII